MYAVWEYLYHRLSFRFGALGDVARRGAMTAIRLSDHERRAA
jgi:hypothetical protein